MTIRVALIEDHPTTILGVESMLEHAKDIEFVKGFPTVPAFFAYARFVRAGISVREVDVVLLDLRLADLSMPYNNAKALIDKKLKVLVYSSLESPYLIRDVLRAGVHGVFEKNRSTEELLEAIRIVSTGNTHATTEWASIIDSNYQALGVDLSPRQQEVLELIASGETDRAIAEMLNIRQSTVNDYVNRIRTKFAQAGCETEGRGELIKQGMYSGILPGPSDPRN